MQRQRLNLGSRFLSPSFESCTLYSLPCRLNCKRTELATNNKVTTSVLPQHNRDLKGSFRNKQTNRVECYVLPPNRVYVRLAAGIVCF